MFGAWQFSKGEFLGTSRNIEVETLDLKVDGFDSKYKNLRELAAVESLVYVIFGLWYPALSIVDSHTLFALM